MKRDSTAPKTDRSPKARKSDPGPASGPRIAAEPATATTCEAQKSLKELAKEYASVRIHLDAMNEREAALKAALITAFVQEGQKAIATEHGLVSYKNGTADKTITDEKAAIAMLEAKKLPLPPTLEAWFKEHDLVLPTTVKKGNAPTVEFRAAG